MDVISPDSPPVMAELAPTFIPHRASYSMGPYIEALCQNFSDGDFLDEDSEEDLLNERLDEDIPAHRLCVVTRRGCLDEQREFDDDEEQGEAEISGYRCYSFVATDTDGRDGQGHGDDDRSVDSVGPVPQVAGVGTPTTSRDEPVVPPILAPGPVGVDRVQRAVPAAPTIVTHSLPVQSQPVQMSASQIQDLIAQKVEQAISSKKSGEGVSKGRPYPVEYEQEPYPLALSLPILESLTGLGTKGNMWPSIEPYFVT
ncbi:hypothetical protein M5K25_003799 [Dendrobium thyrsiflorum]|uniref:Uncharacterized protein n=1 Tax=Dendrobium thyrsiflorum TaxID=117978 RepID=A0ABD0VRZ7_DENTH